MVSYPTRGQLERNLSQRIQAFYRQQLGHQPSKVTCQLFDNKLAIILENAITPAEQILVQEGQENLADQVRSSLEEATHPQLQEIVEEILSVTVADMLSDSTLETGRSGIIAILNDAPKVRNPDSKPRSKRRNNNANPENTEADSEEQ